MAQARPAHSIRKLRAISLLALVLGMGVFTATMLALVANLEKRFGPQVRADLEWRALRGAMELAHHIDLGLAVGDEAMIQQGFARVGESKDVLAIVAIDNDGKVIARTGSDLPAARLFTGPVEAILEGPGYLASWATVSIEGAELGKVGIAVSTARLTETRGTLATVSRTTLLAGGLIVSFGLVFIVFFTRAVASRDAQLNDHAANLERRVEVRTRELDERNRGMRLVLDNVAQGFVTIDMNGTMAAERSAVVDAWFGAPADGARATLSDLVREHAPDFAAWLDANLAMLRDGYVPSEVCLGQMPTTLVMKNQTFALSYTPIADASERLLVIISDVTEQLARQRAERDQRELVDVFQRIGGDRQACEDFLEEGRTLLASLRASEDRALQDRLLHTLKGISGLFGFERFGELCHTIEDELQENGGGLTPAQRARVDAGWAHIVTTTTTLLGDARDTVQIDRRELARVVAEARRGGAADALADRIAAWADEPVARRLERLGQQANVLARRLGKGDLEIAIDDGGVRLDAHRWAPLWSAVVHVVRNAVDHGIETPDERERAGKGRPRLELAALQTERELRISISDDGRGVDWDEIRTRARRAGLPAETKRDLVAALFAGGLSTRSQVTETSGRGVGMSALQATVATLHGSTDVISTPGAGTRIELRFPRRDATHEATHLAS